MSSCGNEKSPFAGESLAQLAEHRTFNPGVLGSSPRRLTMLAVPSSSGLGHSPFKAAARVQIPLGPPFFIASVAQLVEQRTRNAQVNGSSPFAGSRDSEASGAFTAWGVLFRDLPGVVACNKEKTLFSIINTKNKTSGRNVWGFFSFLGLSLRRHKGSFLIESAAIGCHVYRRLSS